MIVRKPSSHFTTRSSNSSFKSSHKPPSVLFDEDDDVDEKAMSSTDYLPQAPISVTIPRHANATGPYCPRRPNLREILSNTSSAPWTLTAFTAYLSNNHCLETLEFIMDAARYRKHYAKMMSKANEFGIPPPKDREYMQSLWTRLIEAYIMSNASREVNLPAEVRDPLVFMPIGTLPPAPEKLDTAVAKIYELMEDSVLVPFLNSFYPQSAYLDCHSFDPPSANDDAVSVATSISHSSQPRLNRRGRSVRSTPASEANSTGTLSSPPPPISNHHHYFRKSAPAPLPAPSDSHHQQQSMPPLAATKPHHATSSPAPPRSDSGRSTRTAVRQHHHQHPPPLQSLPGMMPDDTGSSAESPLYDDSPSTPPTPPLMTATNSSNTTDNGVPKRDLSQLRHTTSASASAQGVWQRLGRLGRIRTGRKKNPPSTAATSAPATVGEK